MDASGKGVVEFGTIVNRRWLEYRMENVLYVPVARRIMLRQQPRTNLICVCALVYYYHF